MCKKLKGTHQRLVQVIIRLTVTAISTVFVTAGYKLGQVVKVRKVTKILWLRLMLKVDQKGCTSLDVLSELTMKCLWDVVGMQVFSNRWVSRLVDWGVMIVLVITQGWQAKLQESDGFGKESPTEQAVVTGDCVRWTIRANHTGALLSSSKPVEQWYSLFRNKPQ